MIDFWAHDLWRGRLQRQQKIGVMLEASVFVQAQHFALVDELTDDCEEEGMAAVSGV